MAFALVVMIGRRLPGILLHVLLCICGLAPSICAADNLRVLVVTGGRNPLYQQFVSTFKQDLPTDIRVAVLETAEDFPGGAPETDLILSVGIKAAEWVAGRTSLPMLATMLPRHKLADLLAQRPPASQTSAIYLDQPWARQVAFLRAAVPTRSRVGVLYSLATRLDIGELRRQLARHGATLVAKQTASPEQLFVDLEEVLSRSDVLLAIPESRIFNSNNIRNILLTSYNRGIPLVGYSQAFVNAGAAMALFSTPEQLAIQARSATISYSQRRRLQEPKAPAFFSVAVNQEVARSLGVAVTSAESLRLQIENPKKTELAP